MRKACAALLLLMAFVPTGSAHVEAHAPAVAYSGLTSGGANCGVEYGQSSNWGPEPLHGFVGQAGTVLHAGATKVLWECLDAGGNPEGYSGMYQEISLSLSFDASVPVAVGIDAVTVEDLAAYAPAPVSGTCSVWTVPSGAPMPPPPPNLPPLGASCEFYLGAPLPGTVYHFYAVVGTFPGAAAGQGFPLLPGSGSNPLVKDVVTVVTQPGVCPPASGCLTHGDSFTWTV